MKVKELDKLSAEEQSQLTKAPALITVLVAAADGKIDPKETSWGGKVIGYRDTVGDEDLFEYYGLVSHHYESQVEELLASELGNQELIASLSKELAALGGLLSKLSNKYAQKLFSSWQTFAKQIAKAEGGFLGFGDISAQEEKLINLGMIDFK